ncbi:MAG TPA: DUF4142 domain-containing protein [Verrucomicrobiae bacterium]|nr:DUF4142 domain-containing protein [Verrucomicrobiae bacterium]
MEVERIVHRFAIVVFAAALISPLITVAGETGAGQNSKMPLGKNFIAAAAKINLAEVELGKLAEQKGDNQAVKDFGKRMVADHTQLESELQDLAKAADVTLPSAPGTNASDLRNQLSADSASKFDQAYIQHMLAGHKQAIAMFENEIEHGQNAQFKSYAETALPVIQDHIRIAEDVAGKMELSGKLGLSAPNKAISASARPA